MSKVFNLENPPKLFRGIWWDDGWEFDGPCVIYTPIKRIGDGNNSGAFGLMVEDICIDISLGKEFNGDWSESNLHEMEWRGWSPRGFARRKKATHLEAVVSWNGEQFDFWIRQQHGPFDS